MKKILSVMLLLMVALISCDKDETKVYLSDKSVAPVISLPQDNKTIVLTAADGQKPFGNFEWSAADYGYPASIQYLIQFSKSADMSRPKVLTSVNLDTKYTALTNLDFDRFLLASLKLTPNVPADIYFRVVASVTGLPTSEYPLGGLGTATRKMNVTAFNTPVDIKTWGIVGSATPNGWNGPDYVMDDGDAEGQYFATVALTAGEIKFRFNNNWDQNLGGSNGTLTAGGANIVIAAAGTYLITLDVKKLTYTITAK